MNRTIESFLWDVKSLLLALQAQADALHDFEVAAEPRLPLAHLGFGHIGAHLSDKWYGLVVFVVHAL